MSSHGRVFVEAARFVSVASIIVLSGCAGGSGNVSPSVASYAERDAAMPSLGSAVATKQRFAPAASLRRAFSAPVYTFVDSAAIARTTETIAVSDNENNVVYAFDPAGHVVAQLGPFNYPSGLASDAKGDLYVADSNDSVIWIYPPGLKGRPAMLSDPGQYPMGVASFDNGKVVAVANLVTIGPGTGSILIYTNGVAGRLIAGPSLRAAFFDTFDATGNLYVTGGNLHGYFVFEIANAATGGRKLTTLKTSNSIGSPGGIEVTTTGKIAVLDTSNGTVYTYNPPAGRSLGSPIATTQLVGADFPSTFAFTKDLKNLYTATYSPAVTLEYAYPDGGGSVFSFSVPGNGQPLGVAVVPTRR